MSVYVTCKCDITSGHLLSCPMASVTTFDVAADYYFLKAQLIAERQRADAAEKQCELHVGIAQAQLREERNKAERLEAALREIERECKESRPNKFKHEDADCIGRIWRLAENAMAERHPNCYGEGCPWCIAHDSIHMAEPKCKHQGVRFWHQGARHYCAACQSHISCADAGCPVKAPAEPEVG